MSISYGNDSTTQFTSNTLKILQSQREQSKSKGNEIKLSFKPVVQIEKEKQNINDITNDLSFDKEYNMNVSNICDDSIAKNVETMRSIFQVKMSERDLMNQTPPPKENHSSVIKIKEKVDVPHDDVVVHPSTAANKLKMIFYILGIVTFLVLISVCIALMIKYLL